jgi:outer membrane translocation and assembly module TamA
MICRTCSRLGILVVLATLCLSRLAYAQSQVCIDNASQPRLPVQETRITIVGVEFEGESPFSNVLQAQLVDEIVHSELWVTPEEPDSSWIGQALNTMRGALQEQGYFKANVDATPYLVLAQANERRYMLRVAIERGPQYRLGNLRFASASDTPLVFTEDLIRQQIRLQEGDLFDVSKVRLGLESIYKLYDARGYIDVTVVPDTKIDEKSSRIELLITVGEERPYSIERIELLGLEPMAQKYLSVPQETGHAFDRTLWESFFKDNGSHLPAHASPEKNMRLLRDGSKGTLDVTLDFRPCPKT